MGKQQVAQLTFFDYVIGITIGSIAGTFSVQVNENALKQTENNIRSEDSEKAKASLEESKKTWKKVKPLLQIDIDNDYVNSIEEDYVKLSGYIETKEKANSLATILLVEDTWKNIGSL